MRTACACGTVAVLLLLPVMAEASVIVSPEARLLYQDETTSLFVFPKIHLSPWEEWECSIPQTTDPSHTQSLLLRGDLAHPNRPIKIWLTFPDGQQEVAIDCQILDGRTFTYEMELPLVPSMLTLHIENGRKSQNIRSGILELTTVPEPITLGLLALAIGSLALRRAV